MDHSIEIAKDVMTIGLKGRLIYSDTAAFAAVIARIRDETIKQCTLDLAGLDHIDSSGLRMVLLTHDACRDKGATLSIRGARGSVRDMLLHCKFDSILQIE